MKHLSGVPLHGRPLALPTNIRLGWKGLPGTNTVNYVRKKFYIIGPWSDLAAKALELSSASSFKKFGKSVYS